MHDMPLVLVRDLVPRGTESDGIASLVARHSRRVPRYTSYPTAAQFTPGVDDATYREWLGRVDPAEPVSLYFHIPFCARLCWYCGCHTGVVNSAAPVTAYVASLLREIDLVADALPERLSASAVHLGGGTPNMLPPDDLRALFAAIRRRFDLLPGAEIAAELDPSSLTSEWVAAAREIGLNRASLGVQDLDPVVQAAINRPQPLEVVARCVAWLRAAGVTSINLDVMYGLPHQTLPGIASTIARLAALAPDRMALFGYAHVPWMKPAQRLLPEERLPDAPQRFAQQEAAARYLATAGYARIGLDHFARETDELARADAGGRLKRNFQGYTTDAAATLLGFGASAIGRLPDGYVQNQPNVPAWRDAIAAGQLPVARGVALTPDDRLRAEVIERLMCDFHADIDAIAASHGRDAAELLTPAALEGLADLAADGLARLERRDGRITAVRVTEPGRSFVRNACALFDVYLANSGARHSASV
jgi:oxygen-independent coproporphyrinogen III oxidase